MIVGIEGIVEKKDPTFVHLNLNGLIHEVNISLNTSNAIKESKVKLLVTQIIREDVDLLFGFMEVNEKKMFDTLIKINGVGPKVAMATFGPTPLIFMSVSNIFFSLTSIKPKSKSTSSLIICVTKSFTLLSFMAFEVFNEIFTS